MQQDNHAAARPVTGQSDSFAGQRRNEELRTGVISIQPDCFVNAKLASSCRQCKQAAHSEVIGDVARRSQDLDLIGPGRPRPRLHVDA